MEYITLKQHLDNESVLGRIRSLSPYPFFDILYPSELDKMSLLHYGDRIVFDKITELSIDSICIQLVGLYDKKWTNLIDINNIDIKNSSERTVTELNDIKQTNTAWNNRDYKVSAFNTDELITDKKDIDDNSSNTDNLENKQLTEKRLSLNIAYNNLSISDKINIINIVLKDIASYLTLDIYP